jgi:glycerol-3-phosphate dehydrogenase
MKHALVVGGTGMLINASLWLNNHGYHVSVIGRNPERMQNLIKKSKNPTEITPILVDYKNDVEFKKQMEYIIQKKGTFDVVIAWVHSGVENVLELISEKNSKNNNKWTLIHVLGSSSDLKEIKSEVPVADNCLYRQVQLGFIIENGHSRWLTNEEISIGVIEAMMNDKLTNIVGVTEPYGKRP